MGNTAPLCSFFKLNWPFDKWLTRARIQYSMFDLPEADPRRRTCSPLASRTFDAYSPPEKDSTVIRFFLDMTVSFFAGGWAEPSKL